MYIKSFESKNNDDYENLSDCLLEIFDKYSIVEWNGTSRVTGGVDEYESENGGDFIVPKNPYWMYTLYDYRKMKRYKSPCGILICPRHNINSLLEIQNDIENIKHTIEKRLGRNIQIYSPSDRESTNHVGIYFKDDIGYKIKRFLNF